MLFARYGYSLVLNQAFQIVRLQIADPSKPKMRCFAIQVPNAHHDERAIWHFTDPADRIGIGVQFGRYVVLFPFPGDATFYERLGGAVTPAGVNLQGRLDWWPIAPTFGLEQ